MSDRIDTEALRTLPPPYHMELIMENGTVLNLVKSFSHQGEGCNVTMKLGKKCGTRALLLELESDKDAPFDLDSSLARLGYAKADAPTIDRERDELRLQLHAVIKNHLAAEVYGTQVTRERDAALAEVERLRAALQSVATMPGIQHPLTMEIRHDGSQMKRVARAALAATPAAKES